jgi:uncharacterized Rmd1/YagE family protein
MKTMNVKIIYTDKEFNLARQWEVPKKITQNDGFYFIFNFGALAFFNIANPDAILKKRKLKKKYEKEFTIKEGKKFKIENDIIQITKKTNLALVSFVLSQYTILEKIDEILDEMIEEMDKIIGKFEKSFFPIFAHSLRKKIVSITYLKNYVVFDLMGGDIPENLIENDEDYMVFEELVDYFDIDSIFQNVMQKIEIILEEGQVLNEFIAGNKEVLLEVIIIILIALEIIFAFLFYGF